MIPDGRVQHKIDKVSKADTRSLWDLCTVSVVRSRTAGAANIDVFMIQFQEQLS